MVSLVLEILGLAISAWQGLATGGAASSVNLANILIQIAQKANQAYTAQTGKPIDPTLLTTIQPV